MKRREDADLTGEVASIDGQTGAELASARRLTPIHRRAFVRLAVARYMRVFLVITGLLVQVVLTVLMWQLVDLTISLMEVWAELARKHLEIVLS